MSFFYNLFMGKVKTKHSNKVQELPSRGITAHYTPHPQVAAARIQQTQPQPAHDANIIVSSTKSEDLAVCCLFVVLFSLD